MIETDRLEHAPDAVAEMKTHQHHCNNVKPRSYGIAEANHDVFVRVQVDELRMNRSGGEVQKVADHEDCDERTAHHHCFRCKTCLHVSGFGVRDRPRCRFDCG